MNLKDYAAKQQALSDLQNQMSQLNAQYQQQAQNQMYGRSISTSLASSPLMWSGATMAFPTDWKKDPPKEKKKEPTEREQLKRWLTHKILNLPSNQ